MKILMKVLISGALVTGAFVLFAPPAQALSATSTMAVSMSVGANCTITAGALAFGAYDPVSANATAPLNGTSTLTVNCTSGAAATITLGQGSNAATGSTDAAPLRRALSGTTNFLSYALYQDSAHTVVWGNTAGTGEAYTGTGASTSVTVFGQVPSGQNVPAGTYSDTVVSTITF